MTSHVIVACWIGYLLIWVISAFFVKPARERHGLRGRWWLIAGVSAVAMADLNRGSAPWVQQVVLPEWMRVLGIPMTVAGLAFACWARFTLGRNWSSTVQFKENHELIRSGPYRFVRHPIYTGLLLMVAGTMLGSGRALAVLATIFATIGLSVKMRQEEALMTRYFPDSYPAYKARTKAIIPFLV